LSALRFRCVDVLRPVISQYRLRCRLLDEASIVSLEVQGLKQENPRGWLPFTKHLLNQSIPWDRRLPRLIALFLFDMDYYFPPLLFLPLVVIMAAVDISNNFSDSGIQSFLSFKSKGEAQNPNTESDSDIRSILISKNKTRTLARNLFAEKHFVLYLSDFSSWSISSEFSSNWIHFPGKSEAESMIFSFLTIFNDWILVHNFGLNVEFKDQA
jgi:hypothetical protein